MTDHNSTVIRALRQRLDKIERENQILRSERDSARAVVHKLDRIISAQQSAGSGGRDLRHATPPPIEDFVSPEEIIAMILRDFPGITIADVIGPRRSRALADVRHACMYAVYIQRPDLSYPALGQIFGGRDHTTVLHAVRKIDMRKQQSSVQAGNENAGVE